MDDAQARDYLERGIARIEANSRRWQRREDYYRGKQDLPYAPEGVNAEYLQLREQAVANWLALAMDTPIQRLRAEGFRTGRDEDADLATWNEVWQPNNLDSRQRIVYAQMAVHGRGLMSVWPNARDKKSPIIRPENSKRVWLEPDPNDPWSTSWVVKTFQIEGPPSRLVLPAGVSGAGAKQVGIVYDSDTWARFERSGIAGVAGMSAWELVDGGRHDLGEPPFVAFDNRQDADAVPQPGIEPLMPAQDAINTIRFQTLLAMQFSAYRQRVFTGYDPVVKDAQGATVYQKAPDGVTNLLDGRGNPIPVVASPGRIGVDRALVFPGTETKVFDMPESNLDNYIKVLGEFLTDLFAVGQVPPQYLLNRMANLSGDALAGAESTLQSLVADLQRWTGESLEQVMRLANRARGERETDLASEVVWADAEAKSFAQLVDGITKLVSTARFPVQAGYEMLPGATPQKVRRWMDLQQKERVALLESDPVAVAADRFRALPAPPPTTDSEVLPSGPATGDATSVI